MARPAETGADACVLILGAALPTVVRSPAVLLAGFGSSSLAETLSVLRMTPGAFGDTVMVIVAVEPAASPGAVQVTDPAECEQLNGPPVAFTNVTPGGPVGGDPVHVRASGARWPRRAAQPVPRP
jgi:hypothetical protein